MDLEFAGDVTAMGDDGVEGDAEAVGNLFVEQPLHDTNDDFLLSVGECLAVVLPTLEDHLGDVLGDIVLSGQTLQTLDSRGEDVVFHLCMLAQPFLVVVDVVEGGCQLVVVVSINWQILDNHEFQFAQLLVRLFVMLGEGVNVVVGQGESVKERLHIGEEGLLLVFHVTTDFLCIFFVELHDELAQSVAFVDALQQFATDEWQLDILYLHTKANTCPLN